MKLLFLCTSNLNRSKTAERYFAERFDMHSFRSAGLSEKYCAKYNTQLCTVELLAWADQIYAMEDIHKRRIIEHTDKTFAAKITVLNIPDEFTFMQQGLIDILIERALTSDHRKFRVVQRL